MSARPRVVAFGLFAVVPLVAAGAGAAPRPRWSDVAEGALPAAPARTAAPASVAASEHLPGISVTRAGDVNRPWASITSSDRRCLRVDDSLRDAPDESADGRRADAPRTAGLLRLPRVAALRSERIVGEGSTARLEIVDAWIDPRSLGAKLVATTSLALAELGRDPHGARVYGFRHGDVLEIVAPVSRMATLSNAEGDSEFVDCAHARFALPVRADGSAAMLVLQPDPPPFSRPAPPSPPEGSTTVAASVSRMSRDRAPLLSVTLAWQPPEPVPVPAEAQAPEPVPVPVDVPD